MNIHKLYTGPGDTFSVVARQASAIASMPDSIDDVVEFDFNGIKCFVDKDTNTDYLYRDYSNAWLMEWKSVGPHCEAKYDHETQTELSRRQAALNEKHRQQQKEAAERDRKQREEVHALIDGIEIELSDKNGWDDWRGKNTDGYGACIFEYAETWARLMQVEIDKGEQLKDIAQSTSFKMGYLGITGFMYGVAVSILSKCWKHGEELRKWHNKSYNHDGDGVVNPAILTEMEEDENNR